MTGVDVDGLVHRFEQGTSSWSAGATSGYQSRLAPPPTFGRTAVGVRGTPSGWRRCPGATSSFPLDERVFTEAYATGRLTLTTDVYTASAADVVLTCMASLRLKGLVLNEDAVEQADAVPLLMAHSDYDFPSLAHRAPLPSLARGCSRSPALTLPGEDARAHEEGQPRHARYL